MALVFCNMGTPFRNGRMAIWIACCLSCFFATALLAQVDNRSHRRIPSPENASNDLLSQFRLMQQLQRMMEERVPVGTMSSDASNPGTSPGLEPPRTRSKGGDKSGSSGMDDLLSGQLPGGIDRRMIQDLMNQLSPGQRKSIEEMAKQLQTPEGLPQATVERLDEQASKLADPQTRQMAQQLLDRYRQLQQERKGRTESGESNRNTDLSFAPNQPSDELKKFTPEQTTVPPKVKQRQSPPGNSPQQSRPGNLATGGSEGLGGNSRENLSTDRSTDLETRKNDIRSEDSIRPQAQGSGARLPSTANPLPTPSESDIAPNGRPSGGNDSRSQTNPVRPNRYLPESNQSGRSQSERQQRLPQQSSRELPSGERSSRPLTPQSNEGESSREIIPDPFAPGESTRQVRQGAGESGTMIEGAEIQSSGRDRANGESEFQSQVAAGNSPDRKGQSPESSLGFDAQSPSKSRSTNANREQSLTEPAPVGGAQRQRAPVDSAPVPEVESTVPNIGELLKHSREHPETLPPLALPPRLSENFKRWSEGMKQSYEARSPENQFMDRVRRSLPSDLQSQLRKSGLEQSIRSAFQEARQSVVEQSSANPGKPEKGKPLDSLAGDSESKTSPLDSANSTDQDWMKKLTRMRSNAESNARSKSDAGSSASQPAVGTSDPVPTQQSKQGLVESITSLYKQATGGANQRDAASKTSAEAAVPVADKADWGSTGLQGLTVAAIVGLVLAVMLVFLTIAMRMNWGEQQARVKVTALAPDAVVIRDRWDVVRVFHRLATRAGLPVQLWWPHQKAAVAIADSAPWAASEADSLTRIYEKARYLPEQYRLTEAQLAAARAAVERINKDQPKPSVRESEPGN